jgi:divalent metal cation (Fe/Co/Zn/Cd) transporter
MDADAGQEELVPPGLLATAVDCQCQDECCTSSTTGDLLWHRRARYARWLAWASLVWMSAEGVVGLIAGISSGSIALTGWALGSAIEGLASVIVVWRFTGSRTLSEDAEQRAQKAVAVSFWLLTPYIAGQAIYDLASQHHPSATTLGIALTASSVAIMPVLGITKQRLGQALGSGATAGEGLQNLMCAAQAAAVLIGLAVTAAWPAAWPVDAAVALGIAAWSAWEGRQAWRGAECC